MSSVERYQEVDSYWYDQVPSHWGKTKNKYVFCQNKHVVGENWEKFTLLTMGKSGVKPRDMNDGGKFPASFETYQTVEPNQLIFCLFDLDETPRTIGMSKDHGMITSAYDVFSTTEGNNPQFWTYFYQMIDDHKGLRPFYTGLRKVVRSETFMGIEVFSPPLEEQKLISRYLDKKTEQIDSLIEKIQKKIELLKEQRISLINQCVTKGLDPNVEMKDSGVEWIGEIPSHWSVSKIMFISKKVTDGSHHSPETQDSGKLYVTVSNVSKSNDIDFASCSKISEESFSELEKNGCRPKKEDILITKDGTIGRGLVVGEFNEYVILSSIGLIRFSKKINPEYGLYYLLSGLNIDQMYSHVRGSGITRLTINLIKNLLFIIPTFSEQQQIVEYLDKKTGVIDKTISIEERKRELLTEYRQSLISSVVTGKVRVTEDMI